jgi:hypothetical protein
MRGFFAVVAGVAVWTVLWIGSNQGLIALLPEHVQPGLPIEHVGVLVYLIVFSSALSVLAGWITATLATRSPMGHVWALALIHLSLGIFFQATAWTLFPIWYHLVFLGLVVPMTLWGGRIRTRRRDGAR